MKGGGGSDIFLFFLLLWSTLLLILSRGLYSSFSITAKRCWDPGFVHYTVLSPFFRIFISTEIITIIMYSPYS